MAVVGRIMAPKYVHPVIPGTSNISFMWLKDLADVMELRDPDEDIILLSGNLM